MRIHVLFRSFLLLILSLTDNSASTQILNPVKWDFIFREVSGNEFDVIARGNIDKGWHIYALNVSDDPAVEGPIPTSIVFRKLESFQTTGPVKQGKYITHFDPNFGMDLNYFEKQVEFVQRFKRKSNQGGKLTGTLEYMACDDERCIFPDPVEFSISVPASSESKASSDAPPADTPVQSSPAPSGMLEPYIWKVSVEKKSGSGYDLIFTATGEPGWHIYAQQLESTEGPIPTSFQFVPAEGITFVNGVSQPRPKRMYDPNFMMNLDYFEGITEFRQSIQTTSSTPPEVTASITFMCCNEEICLPHRTLHYKIQLATGTVTPFDPDSAEIATNPSNNDPFRIDKVDLKTPVSQCGQQDEEYSLWSIFLLGIVGGLLALVTPCVFPMVPLTVSFFTKGSGGKNGKQRAILYGFFILIIYFLLSLPFHLSKSVDPEVLNNIATNMWLNVAFFVVFMVFAVSFFGYFEITLPSSFANRVDRGSNLSGGLGIFFMALTLAIVSFSCTGPILGSVIGSIYASDVTGTVSFLGLEMALPAAKVSAAMIGFGLSLGLPFGLFAAFPSMLKKLPKSGGWLEDFKVSLGFLEVALALKFLSNADLVEQWGIIRREIFFAVWIVIGVLWVLYLLNRFAFKAGQGSQKLTATKVTFAVLIGIFTLRLVPGLFPPSEINRFAFLSGFPPPRDYSFYDYKEEFKIYHDLKEAMAVAREQNKPVFIDFTGWACVNCRKMEANVWPDPRVKALLVDGYIVCSLYVDERVELPEEEQFVYTTRDGRNKKIRTVGSKWATLQTETFENNSQPFYALLAPDSTLLAPPRQYNEDAAAYADWLECGQAAFRSLSSTIAERTD